jgi:hypothetical protein
MNMLMVLAVSASEAPTRTFLPAVYLPETWMKVAFIATVYVVLPAWIGIHAWIVLHQRRNFMPPYTVLRLQQWWYGLKPGKRMIGMGRRDDQAHS